MDNSSEIARHKWVLRLPWELIFKASKQYKLEPQLIASVIHVESAGNPFAARYESGYRYTFDLSKLSQHIGSSYSTMEQLQKTSWGLMQVMGSVFYELGGANEADEDYRWPNSMCIPSHGIKYGCLKLREIVDKYGDTPDIIYAAYNAGSPRFTKGGLFVNQLNVDRFTKIYRLFKD